MAGVALSDVFALSTYGWEDDVDDLPLEYTFAYVSGSAVATDTASEVIVRAAAESSEATDVYLPQVCDACLDGMGYRAEPETFWSGFNHVREPRMVARLTGMRTGRLDEYIFLHCEASLLSVQRPT